MQRGVVFVGNCQARSLAHFYRERLADPILERVFCVEMRFELDHAGKKALDTADLIVLQDLDFRGGITAERFRVGTRVVHFPVVACPFLWPFIGRQHPKNRGTHFYGGGPFPPGLSDSFLNRLIAKGVGADEAVDQYLSVDFAKVTNLDRLYEIGMANQRQRDAKCGMSFADTIERHVRDESLFVNFGHPRLRVFRALARQVYAAMGVSGPAIETALSGLVRPPFPYTALPIHPAVGRHFGLSYATESARYSFNYLGPITFAEYVRRYVAYDWNAELHEGIWLAGGSVYWLDQARGIWISGGQEPERALALVDSGLDRSPSSSFGHRARGAIQLKLGRGVEARWAARLAVDLDPDDPDNLLFLARVTAEAGDRAAGLALAELAMARFPSYAPAHQLLADLLFKAGRLDDTVQAARRGAELLPGNPQSQDRLGRLLLEQGDIRGAEKALRRAVSLGFAPPATRVALAAALHKQGGLEDAIDEAMGDLARAPADRAWQNLVAQYLRWLVAHTDDPVRAQALVERATEVAPRCVDFHRILADILARRGRCAEAERAYRDAIAIDPGHAPDHVQISFLLIRLGRPAEAEMAARQAIALAPTLPGGHIALGYSLGQGGRLEEASDAVRRGVELQPNNPNGHALLASYEMLRGRLEDARRGFARAVELQPDNGAWRRSLANVLYKTGRVEDAIAEIRRVVAANPDDATSVKLLDAWLAAQPNAGRATGRVARPVIPVPASDRKAGVEGRGGLARTLRSAAAVGHE
jgi:tetratricopeptide (TPR) repeat protein